MITVRQEKARPVVTDTHTTKVGDLDAIKTECTLGEETLSAAKYPDGDLSINIESNGEVFEVVMAQSQAREFLTRCLSLLDA